MQWDLGRLGEVSLTSLRLNHVTIYKYIYIYVHLFMYIYIYIDNGNIIGFNGDVSKTHQGINQPFDGDMFWDI